MQQLSADYHTRTQVGDIVSRFSSDLASVENALIWYLPSILQAAGAFGVVEIDLPQSGPVVLLRQRQEIGPERKALLAPERVGDVQLIVAPRRAGHQLLPQRVEPRVHGRLVGR